MNKFEQVSSGNHQISLAGDQAWTRGVLRSHVWSQMMLGLGSSGLMSRGGNVGGGRGGMVP